MFSLTFSKVADISPGSAVKFSDISRFLRLMVTRERMLHILKNFAVAESNSKSFEFEPLTMACVSSY